MHVITREEWGARPPTKTQYYVPLSEREYFFAHYLGLERARPNRVAQLQATQRFHQGTERGWSDIGYNYVIDQDGHVYEGRGRNAVGAHCPNYNRNGIGVLFMLGDTDNPTEAAKTSFLTLHRTLEQAKGGKLHIRGHRDGKSTKCPGDTIYRWLKYGTPVIPHNPRPPVVLDKEYIMGLVIMKGSAEQAFLTDGLTQKRWIKSGNTVQAMRLDGFRFVEGSEYTSVLAKLNEGPPID